MLGLKQFGDYEIIRKLGRGMTDVYLAFDHAARRQAVLKIVEPSADPLTQVIIEAERRGAALQKQLHEFDPRVVDVYEYGDRDNCFFVAMQYIDGRNIAEILKEEKRFTPERAAQIALEICRQLERLHSYLADIDGQHRAVVHGDIKPSNVQIAVNDEVRLLDFGIAKAITFTHSLTHHNFGSPGYCSPERLSKAQVDHHADLWALGVTLYEMVSGALPYHAQNTRKLEALIQSRRPPRALPSDCPPGLGAIICKALSGDLHQRYVSATAFADDLRLFIGGQQTAAERETRVGWNTNETVGKLQPPRRPSPPTIAAAGRAFSPRARKLTRALHLVSALLWGLLAGLVVFVPAGVYYRYWTQSAPLRHDGDFIHHSAADIEKDWEAFRQLQGRNAFLGDLSPVRPLARSLKAGLSAAADDVIEGYRIGSDGNLNDFDWAKAAACLRHVLEIDPGDRAAKSKLALCSGYLSLARSRGDDGAAKTAADNFGAANTLAPRLADPHLGLARMYIYSQRNVGLAMAELHAAERLGYTLGPREMEEQADGYRFRALEELMQARKAHAGSEAQGYLALAERDFGRARLLYEPILGFSHVSYALRELDVNERDRQRLNERLKTPSAATAHRNVRTARKKVMKAAWRKRRWR